MESQVSNEVPSEFGMTRSIAVPAIAAPAMLIAALLQSSSAWAGCATSGGAPVTLTCSGAVTTTNTTNSTSPNPNTSDRIQTFADSINATVNSGTTITGAGLAATSTLNGSTVSLTNNGAITAGIGGSNAAVAVGGSGSNFNLSYSGSGNITGTGTAGALQLVGAGSGTTTATISATSVLKTQASGGLFSGLGIQTAGTSGNVNVTVQSGGVVQGSNAVQFDGTGSNTLTNSGIIGTNLATTPATVATNGISANTANNNSVTVINHGTGTISGSITGILAGSMGSVAITNDVGGSITATNTIAAMGANAASVGISAGSVTGSNSGTISGSTHGIDTSGSLPNQGFGTSVNLTSNSGMIEGTATAASGLKVGSGILAETSVTVGTNSGTISGGLNGIAADNSFVTVNNNTGTITGLSGVGILAATTATVTNGVSGMISGGTSGIRAANVDLTNSGTVSGGIVSSTGTLSVTNNMGATISGGIGAGGTSATIMNSGTVTGTGTGITVSSTMSNITNNVGATISGTGVVATGISSFGGAGITLSNAGIVSGTSMGIGSSGDVSVTANTGTITGVVGAINAGSSGTATITNNAGGQIMATGAIGAGIGGGSIVVSNAGMISGAGGGLNTNGSVTVTSNTGTISSTGGLAAISAGAQTSVANGSTGIISTNGSGSAGIFVNGAAATVVNSGNITASGAGGIGVVANGLTVTNNSGAMISGAQDGVNQQVGGATSVMNAGTIIGTTRSAVRLGSNASVTNTGMISGATGIVYRDPTGTGVPVVNGSVFNSGTITGTGGTAINFNVTGNSGPFTLTLGPGSIINGNVLGTGGDVFQLGGASGNDSFNVSKIGASQQYQGFTTFNKVDGSTWQLSGTGTQTWNVSGGVLEGTATIGGLNVKAGGTFMPGNGTAGTSMTITGNLSFASGAAYLVQINPATASSANVTGNAALNGASVQANFAAGSYMQHIYTILHASGGIGMTQFSGVTGMPAGFTAQLQYTTTDVQLGLTAALGAPPGGGNPGGGSSGGGNSGGPSALGTGGLNGNQQNIATALNNFFNGGGMLPSSFVTLFGLTGTSLNNSLTQISGETATGSQQATFAAMTQFIGVMTDPFIAGRGDPLISYGGAPPFAEQDDDASAYATRGTSRSASERDAYAAIYRKAPPVTDQVAQRWSVWAAGFGGSQSTDGNTGLASNSATSRVAAAAVGADYRFSPFTLAGFALAGGGTSFGVANGGSGRSDLFQVGAYIRHTSGPAYVAGGLAYGWQDITTDRMLTIAGIDRLHAEFNANAFSGRAEGGYRFVQPLMGGVGITPYAAAQFITFDLPAYAEQALSGANTFALAYGARDVTDTRSELGIRTDKSYAMQDSVLTLRGRVAWAHDFDPSRNIAATFQALPGASFVVNGAAQASDSALVTASAEAKWLNGWSAAATFEGEFSAVTRSYAGKGVVRYSW